MESYEKKYKDALERAKLSRLQLLDIGEEATEIEYIFPELKESEDEKIIKAIHVYLDWLDGHKDYQPKGDYTIKDMIAWIKKHDGHKPVIEMKSPEESLGVSSKEYNDIVNDCLYGESKSAEEVEPKFHEGEWITNGDYTWKIVEAKPLDYILQSQNGNIVDDTISHVDEQFNLWTIQDAKDGDVLVTKKGNLFIYDKNRYDNGLAYYYVGLVNKELTIKGPHNMLGHFGELHSVFPATKDQHDTLLKAMADAGYTFDFEKKELKKSNSYCQEHYKGFQETGKCFADGDCKDKREAERKSAIWNEDDDYKLSMCISAIQACYKWDSMIDWLKSLKQRIGG